MIRVRLASGPGEVREALALRHAVFVIEQQVPVEDERDGRDAEALHLVAVDDGRVVATCRLVRAGDAVRLGRLAVAPAARRLGIASRLLAEADAQARACGARRIVLAAQLGARALYERAGYRARGERFEEAGIPHVMMEKAVG